MRVLKVACAAGLLVACGGRASRYISDSAPVGAGGDASAGDVVEAAGADSGEAMSLPPGKCSPGISTDAVSGTIAGVGISLDQFWSRSTTGVPIAQASWSDLRVSSPDQALLAWGTGGPEGGPQQSAGALIVVPKRDMGATFYCAAGVTASASLADMGHAVSIALTDLSVLGECPGTIVSGEVDVCLGGSDAGAGCTESFGVTGTVDGTEVRFRNLGGTIAAGGVGDDFEASVMGDANDGAVILFEDAPDGKLRGWLRLPDTAPSNASSVFCLSDALVVAQANGAYSITFQRIGRLGHCPGTPVDGALGYCLE